MLSHLHDRKIRFSIIPGIQFDLLQYLNVCFRGLRMVRNGDCCEEEKRTLKIKNKMIFFPSLRVWLTYARREWRIVKVKSRSFFHSILCVIFRRVSYPLSIYTSDPACSRPHYQSLPSKPRSRSKIGANVFASWDDRWQIQIPLQPLIVRILLRAWSGNLSTVGGQDS